LKVYTLYDSPIDYALTQNKLGTAYRVLADIKDTVANCEKAIQHYQEALKVYTLDDYPVYYAAANNNLGIAYQALAEVKDRGAINCEKAIQYYQEALKVFNEEGYRRIIEKKIEELFIECNINSSE